MHAQAELGRTFDKTLSNGVTLDRESYLNIKMRPISLGLIGVKGLRSVTR